MGDVVKLNVKRHPSEEPLDPVAVWLVGTGFPFQWASREMPPTYLLRDVIRAWAQDQDTTTLSVIAEIEEANPSWDLEGAFDGDLP